MTFYPTFDIHNNSITLTVFDPINYTFFDPVTDKNYDHPFVFKNDTDLHNNLPTLIQHIILNKQKLIQQQQKTINNLATTITIIHNPNSFIYYYPDPITYTVKSATKIHNIFYDTLTQLPIQFTTYHSFEQAYSELQKLISPLINPLPLKHFWQPS